MKQKSNSREKSRLLSFLPHRLYLPQTFPDLVQAIGITDSSQSRQKLLLDILRQYQSNFYKGQIKMLLRKMERIQQICRIQSNQIEELKSPSQNKIPGRSEISESQKRKEGIEWDRLPENDTDRFIIARLKNDYLTQIDKFRYEYERKLRHKQTQKIHACQALQMKYSFEVAGIKDELEKLKKQKLDLAMEVNRLKQNECSFDEEQRRQLESYKEENAILRNFIQKMKRVEEKMKKLEEEKKQYRDQFLLFAEENQKQKRQLFRNAQDTRLVYEQKLIKLEESLKEKQEVILKLMKKNDEVEKMNTQEKVAGCIESPLIYSIQKSETPQSSHQQKIQWLKMENSMQVLSNNENQNHCNIKLESKEKDGKKKQLQQIEALKKKVKQLEKKLRAYQKDSSIKSQDKGTHERELMIKRQPTKLSHFEIPEVQSQVDNLAEKEQQWKIRDLEQQLLQEKSYNKKVLLDIEEVYKSKQTAIKFRLEMSENSYKQLWDRFIKQSENNQHLSDILKQKQYEEKEKQLYYKNKQNNLLIEEEKSKWLLNENNELKRSMAKKKELIIEMETKLENLQGFRKADLLDCLQDSEGLSYTKKANKGGQGSSRKQIMINELQTKCSMMEAYAIQMEKTVASMQNQFKITLEGKERIINSLEKRLNFSPLPNKASTFTPIWNLFCQSSNQFQEIKKLQTEISEIHCAYQAQVNQLKGHIKQLLNENDLIRSWYTNAQTQWKHINQSLQKYKQMMERQSIKIANSSTKKIYQKFHHIGRRSQTRTFKERDEQVFFPFSMIVQQGLRDQDVKKADCECIGNPNDSEIFSIPDFSQCKLQEITQKKQEDFSDESSKKRMIKKEKVRMQKLNYEQSQGSGGKLLQSQN